MPVKELEAIIIQLLQMSSPKARQQVLNVACGSQFLHSQPPVITPGPNRSEDGLTTVSLNGMSPEVLFDTDTSVYNRR